MLRLSWQSQREMLAGRQQTPMNLVMYALTWRMAGVASGSLWHVLLELKT